MKIGIQPQAVLINGYVGPLKCQAVDMDTRRFSIPAPRTQKGQSPKSSACVAVEPSSAGAPSVPLGLLFPPSNRNCEITTSVTVRSSSLRSVYFRVCNRPSTNSSWPLSIYSPQISATR